MTAQPIIILSVVDYAGTEVILYDTTLSGHILKQHPYFSADPVSTISSCLTAPFLVHTNPQDHAHPDRHNYYGLAAPGPRYRRIVVDHTYSPSIVITAWPTDHVPNSGTVVYMSSGGRP